MPRPRRCYLCTASAVVVVEEFRPYVVIYRDGRVERGGRWEGRFLCVDHQDVDPWKPV